MPNKDEFFISSIVMQNYQQQYELEKLKKLYNQYSFKPSPVKVSFLAETHDDSEPRNVKLWWKVRDNHQVKTSIFQKTYLHNGQKYETIGLPDEIADIGAQATSYDGKRSVVIKLKADSKSSKMEQFIVIYDGDGSVNTIAIKSLNATMRIVLSPLLSSLVLSPDGTLLLCVVEVQTKSKSMDESVSTKEYDLNGHEYKQSWGERYSSITHTSISLINLNTHQHVIIDKPNVSLCQPFFYKSNDNSSYSIGCIGFPELPYKLGLIFCTNRKNYLFTCKVASDLSVSQIEPEIYYGQAGKLAINSPRVYYNHVTGYDNHVIFLERDSVNAHNTATRLQQLCLKTGNLRTIVDNKASREIIKLSNDTVTYSEVGPLFLLELPTRCFTTDGKFIIFDSETPLSTRSFAVQVKDGKMHALNIPLQSSQVLAVQDNWICIVGSSINCLPNVYLGRFVDPAKGNIRWVALEDEKSRVLSNIMYGTFMFPSRDFPDKYVTGIWTSPRDLVDKDCPMIAFAHGGPASHYSDTYNQSVALYTELGLKTCLVNYVGSTGVDEDYLEVILGKIGTVDIHDFYDSIQYMIKHHKVDPNGIILNGGSHGGFLVTHLAGQHPEMNFAACIARNPVIDFSVMPSLTDVPDFVMASVFGELNPREPSEVYARNVDELGQMYRLSPIAHIHKVKVPTLLLLGTKDLRVPCSQSLLYHRLLKARGVETRCLTYEDMHDLSKIDVAYDCFLNMVKFIEKFLYKIA